MTQLRGCAECGGELAETRRGDARYCVDGCKQRAYRRRRAEREETELRALARAARRAVYDGELEPEEALELLIWRPGRLREAVRRQQLEAAA